MKVGLTPCHILHQRSYKESSLILDVFSREYGKLSLVSRGIKKKKTNERYLMQANQRLNIAWSIRGEMGTLTDIESDGNFTTLDGSRAISAFYLAELLVRLLHKHEPYQKLFDAYSIALGKLKKKSPEDTTLRVFEKHLISSLGYGLVLDHDVDSGMAIEEDKNYFYYIDHGPVENQIKTSGFVTVSGRTLITLDRENIDNPIDLLEAKNLMRKTLKKHLGDKPLASRELYRAFTAER